MKLILHSLKIVWRLNTSILFFYFLLSISQLKSQSNFQFGLNLNPIISQTSSENFTSSPEGYIKLQKNKLSYSLGLNFTYYINNKVGIYTGVNTIKKKFSLIQDKFQNDSIRGEILNSPTYHTTEIPFLFVYKINSNSETHLFKAYIGASFDFNNFNMFTTSGTFSAPGDTVFFESKYQFQKINSTSIIGGLRFEKIIKHGGNIEIGISYHYSLNELAPLDIKTTIGKNNSEIYTASIKPQINYIGFDIVYYFYNHLKRINAKVNNPQ